MGPINLAKIKAAHEKLMRLDPEYSSQWRKQRRQKRTERAAPLKTTPFDHYRYENHLQQIVAYDRELERLDRSTPGSNITAASSKSVKHLTERKCRDAKHYEFRGESLTVSEIAIRLNIPSPTLRNRLKQGYSIAEAIAPIRHAKPFTYAGKTLTLEEWANEAGIKLGTLRNRLAAGWSLEAALTVASGTVMGRKSHGGGWVKPSPERVLTAHAGPFDSPAKQAIFPADCEGRA